ncbi:MAG: translocation protein TolB [Acidobacteriaceae bacterium]|jgi:TolB protein
MDSKSRKFRRHSGLLRTILSFAALAMAAVVALLAPPAGGQDNIFTNTNSGATSIRIAVADFKPLAADAQSAAFKQTFDATFYADLANAGIFDIVSKSLLPPANPGSPAEMQVQSYATAPASAAFVTFGSLGVVGGKLVANGYLFDAKNTQYPQVLAKQYSEDATDDSARQVAHRFADEIIFRLGGGTPGIAETKIYFVKTGGGGKEIWAMDYDGANQRPITHLGTSVMSPRISPDNSRLAFAALGRYGFQLKMYSLLLDRYVTFPSGSGSSASPAWSPNGNELAYAAAPDGQFNIWIADSNGNLARKVTSLRGGNVSPVYNPKTGAQVAFISAVTGLPQLYIMNTDGSGVQRLTDGGYASSPSWSPNGQLIAFAWDRKYGPGAPGGQDIYVIPVTPGADGAYHWVQLTWDGGRCDFPSWSPDGRHIVYANSADGRPEHMRIWSMLADHTQKHPLTGPGADMPNWSWK